MSTTLVLRSDLADELLSAAQLHVESAGILLARVVSAPSGSVRLLGQTICWVPDNAYEVRHSDSLRIRSEGFVPPLRQAEENGCIAIWFHTHPGDGASPSPSPHDRVVDTELSPLFMLRSGSGSYG